jgi:thioredoxin reductase (NADPH)
MTVAAECEVVVVGAGPVGIFSVFACGQLGMRCQVIDALSQIGGQCTALYPEKPIYDIPGFPSIEAADLIVRLEQQAAPFAPRYHLNQQAIGLRRNGARMLVETSAGVHLAAQAVILAAGVGAFGPNRPPLEGIESLEGRSVFYWITQRERFRGKTIAIAGGGDSAIDWALALNEIAAGVTLVHRRNRFRAAPASVAKLDELVAAGRIRIKTPFQLAELHQVNGGLEAITIADLDGRTERIPAQVLLPFFGLASDLTLLKGFGVELKANQVLVDALTMETAQPGVFAVGDVAGYAGKQKLILSGFVEATTAARSAFDLAFPGQAFQFQHSTHRGAPRLVV